VLGETRVIVAINAGDGQVSLPVWLPDQDGRTFAVQRWPSGPAGPAADALTVTEGRLTLDLAARDGAVLVAG